MVLEPLPSLESRTYTAGTLVKEAVIHRKNGLLLGEESKVKTATKRGD
jgi:hypothetical protein